MSEKKDEQPKEKDPQKEKAKPGSMQSISLLDYLGRQEKEAQKPKLGLPQAVKMILMIPVLVIFLFGIFFVPYVVYQIATGEEKKVESSVTVSHADLMKK